ncbi:MarR family transcriptional regulator [Bradyrhizobium sp. Arg237L]|uniref:MarR family transcriptional regulator n=1 Tax=Bradyrhizobium sp. Arg237L TaxID=3003352 RepID=UPI00249DD59B|nr:MarR family transcriptional regulator [Bradyrhizobium sp. Arg237L]MDI4238274.1 MarR family transcriptional regulator [Bradyrhizobium sp. Arg237L]
MASIPFERGLPVGLLRAREAVMFHMRPVLRSHGTTEQQWRVLRSLNEAEPMDKTTLADRSALLMPSLLRILKDLKQEGLIRLVRSTSNRRLSGVALTAKGAAYVTIVTASINRKSQILKAAIGESTVEQLLALLRDVEVSLHALRTPED